MLFIALCLTVIVFCWAATAVMVGILWPGLRRGINSLAPALAADCIFLLQILPLLASATLVSLFVIPGFAAWEPAHSDERVSIWLTGTSLFALVLILGAAFRLYFELRQQPVIPSDRPFVAVLGCLRPRVVISDATRVLLSTEELRAVLRHEAAHIERRDNFRLLSARLVSLLTFSPRCWNEMELTRARMTEFAADSSAATDDGSALDLAQALVKIARDSAATQYRFASSLASSGSRIQERVLRLLNRRAEPSLSGKHLALFVAVVLAVLLRAALHHDLQYFCYRGLERLVAL